MIDLDRRGAKAVRVTAVAATGTEVWLPGFGSVKVFGIVAPNGDTADWATNDLAMTALERAADCSRAIEHYHSGVKQCRCPVFETRFQFEARGATGHPSERAGERAPLALKYHTTTYATPFSY